MALLEDLQWRYATKAYDPTKKVSREHIDKTPGSRTARSYVIRPSTLSHCVSREQ